MPDVSFTNLLVICAVAVAAPLLAGVGYLITLVLGGAAGAGFHAAGWVGQPLVLAIALSATRIGMELGQLSATTGAALICAGLLSVLFFPPIALALLRDDRRGGASRNAIQALSTARNLH